MIVRFSMACRARKRSAALRPVRRMNVPYAQATRIVTVSRHYPAHRCPCSKRAKMRMVLV